MFLPSQLSRDLDRHPLGGLARGRIVEMDIAVRRAGAAMPEQPPARRTAIADDAVHGFPAASGRWPHAMAQSNMVRSMS